MAKIQTGISIDENIAEEAKEIGKRHHWESFSQIVEMGLELFIEKYGKTKVVIVPIETPELEQVAQ
jgi:hypothetical protein